MVYKTDENSVSLTGDLWAFRPILNLEHVSQKLKALDNPQKHALLAYFLDNVSTTLCMFILFLAIIMPLISGANDKSNTISTKYIEASTVSSWQAPSSQQS